MMIAIPSGIQIFCWIATIWAGRPRLHVPMLFVLGFVVVFVIGGLTGVMVASVPFDQQVHDTYFVVAHFHYVLIGGAVFPLFGAFYYWFPKVTGPDAERAAGAVALLAVLHRREPHLLPDAPARASTECRGGSTPISPETGLGESQPAGDHRRRDVVAVSVAALPRQRGRSLRTRRCRRATIPGAPTRWSGRRRRRRARTTSPSSRWWRAGRRSGTEPERCRRLAGLRTDVQRSAGHDAARRASPTAGIAIPRRRSGRCLPPSPRPSRSSR